MHRALVAVGLLAAIAAGGPARAGVDWNGFANVQRVNVVTADEDGEPRETTVWLVVVDGAAYIRTGGTHWGSNVERDPRLLLRIEGEEIPVTVDFVTDEAQREKIAAAFREKYGFWDGFMSIFRGSRPKIMRLTEASP